MAKPNPCPQLSCVQQLQIMSDTEVKAFMVKSIQSIIDLIDDIKAEWISIDFGESGWMVILLGSDGSHA